MILPEFTSNSFMVSVNLGRFVESRKPSVVRESHVVKNVENLAKKREERRAKQEEQKIQRQELMNLDPGNPQWEFLAMIRSVAPIL
jgi:kinesin family protein 2/24